MLYFYRNFQRLILCYFTFLSVVFIGCSNDGGIGLGESTILSSETAFESWPNETTSELPSSEITSKILVSDLNSDGAFENIFITVLPNSSDTKSSVVRVTGGSNYIEVANFKSTRVFFLQDSIPFSGDMDNDGQKEILLVSQDLRRVHALEYKRSDLSRFFVRWSAKLPKALPEDFDRQLLNIFSQGKEMVRIGDYGIYEKPNGKPKVVHLKNESDNSESDDDDDDDDDD